jgi:putative ABC transport system permease protein
LFVIESGLLGLVGGIIGALVGISLAFAAAFAANSALPGVNFKISLSPLLLLLAITFSFVIGTISGLLPAIQASRLSPVEALRK